MTVLDFISKHTFNQRDINIAKKLHSNKNLSESEWLSVLKKDFHFEQRKQIDPIVEISKEEKKSSDNKDEEIKNKKSTSK